jgi:regulation of enolase protein 1 (concanavalin A-like superfamily)
MLRLSSMMFVLAFTTMLGFTTTVVSEPPRSLEGWGGIVDPAGDCQIRLDKKKLTIAVPGTKHDLSAELGDTTAPRVLRDIEGDFIAQVKVAGNVSHAGKGLAHPYMPYHGAGLLLFVDDKTYLRLERAAIVHPQRGGTHYANLELRSEGRRPTSGNALKIPDVDTYLRLERRGGQVIASVSEDGLRWIPLKPIAVQLLKRVKLGVAAVNTSSDPFKAEFTELDVFVRDKEPKNP